MEFIQIGHCYLRKDILILTYHINITVFILIIQNYLSEGTLDFLYKYKLILGINLSNFYLIKLILCV